MTRRHNPPGRAERRRRRWFRRSRVLGRFETLEERRLLSATPNHPDGHAPRDLAGFYYHALTELPDATLSTETAEASDIGDYGTPLDLSQTFKLHSNPGAAHTIYLDFDGHRTSGTRWNSSYNGGADIVTPAYDTNGNPNVFTDAELLNIQRMWQRVAEDFLPFDVNVTTEEPDLDDLIRTDANDTRWGIRVVIGGGSNDWLKMSAGGIAYVNSFSWDSDTPVFVFENQLGNGNEKYTAEAISHEVGHTLGLSHDGGPSAAYYQGHGSGETGWAPIMGVGYYRELTQWSRGEYSGATNPEDDLKVIVTKNGFGYRQDDHGNTAQTATDLGAVSSFSSWGIIERSSDVDVFTFTVGAGDLSLTINPAPRGPNLDIYAELYDATSSLIASSNPTNLLSASFDLTLPAGQYFLHISGVGRGDPISGYSDYASIGSYWITGEGATPEAEPPDQLSISAANADQVEGDSGTKPFTFTVTRTGSASTAASVKWALSDDSQTNAADFAGGVLPSGTVSFAAGVTQKTITIHVRGDTTVEGDETFTVVLSNPVGAEIETATAIGIVRNDDVERLAGISVTPLGGYETTEAGDTVKFSVVLDSAPTHDVTIPLRSSDISEGVVNKESLTFTPENWNVPQNFVVRGVDDRQLDGDVEYYVELLSPVTEDAEYAALGSKTITLKNLDDDVKEIGYTITPLWGYETTEAGDKVKFAVVLDVAPTHDVTIPLHSSDTSEGLVNKKSLTFTPENWNEPQYFVVTGVDDRQLDGDVEYYVELLSPVTEDAEYAALGAKTITLKNLDDDVKGIGYTITPLWGYETTEAGDKVKFAVVLDVAPTHDVTIPLRSSDTSEGLVNKKSLTFTPENWNEPQYFVVTGVDDRQLDGDVEYYVELLSPVTEDAEYAALDAQTITLKNLDDDVKGIGYTITPLWGYETTEAGDKVKFAVVLDVAPTHDVTIPLRSSDTSEGLVNKKSLTFTRENWNEPQYFVVRGVDDRQLDGDVEYYVELQSPVTEDAEYAVLDAQTIPLKNLDDDVKEIGYTITPLWGYETTEAGDKVKFAVVLDVAPTHNVTIPLRSSDTSEGAVNKASITFTPDNWKEPKHFVVRGVDDRQIDGDVDYYVELLSPVTEDAEYAALDPKKIALKNLDDDVKEVGYTITPLWGYETTEAGDKVKFAVALDVAPTHNVTIPLRSSDTSEGVVNKASITFTPDNWKEPKHFVVRGVDDRQIDGDIDYYVELLSPVTEDAEYAALASKTIALKNLDDDVNEIGYTVTALDGYETSESGDKVKFALTLDAAPTHEVIIPLVSLDTSEGVVNKASLIFTPANWNVPQYFVVRGVDDREMDGDVGYSVRLRKPITADPEYAALTATTIPLTNIDNDEEGIGITVSALSGYETSESGERVRFEVKLTAPPLAEVLIRLQTTDATEGIVNKQSLRFSPFNWSTPQYFVVLGRDDDLADGDIAYKAVLMPQSADVEYDALAPVFIPLINRDNESSPKTALSASVPMDETRQPANSANDSDVASAGAADNNRPVSTSPRGLLASEASDTSPWARQVDHVMRELSS